MIKASDFLYLPYSRDLIEGSIAYALNSLPYQFHHAGRSACESLRRVAAGAAVELAFRRYLSQKKIPFEVKSALPFTEHERYDVILGERRCEIQSFLISHPGQIAQLQRIPELVLKVPALVASDQHAAEGRSPRDLYVFAFLLGQVTASREELQGVIETRQPHYLIHVMPEAWKRPSAWNPLGTLVLKSESEETQTVEIGGQDEGRGRRSLTVELPPRTRVEIQNGFFSVSYLHPKSRPDARIGIYSSTRRETYLIGTRDWDNLWIYGLDIALVGYITHEEFSRHASFLPPGSRVFQYQHTQVKNLALPMSELRPLSELFERLTTPPSVTAS